MSWIGLLVVISGGMLEANWSFRPEVNLGVRHRVRPSGPQTQSPIKSSAARGIDWQLTPYLSTRGLGVQGVF